MTPVKIAAPQSHGGLTLFPRCPADHRAHSQPPWTLLSDAGPDLLGAELALDGDVVHLSVRVERVVTGANGREANAGEAEHG